MDPEEYERRKQALEEIYEADLEMVRAAHEVRLRSLEALWLSSAPGPAPGTAAAPAEAPAPKQRNPDLRTAVEEIFDRLPDVFEKRDVTDALGWQPSRSSLYRILLDLARERRIRINPSLGRHPSQYRKL